MAIKHSRSSTQDNRPVPTSMAAAQIAINTSAASPGAYFRASDDTLIKIGPIHIGSTAPNASPAGSSGNSIGEGWVDTSGASPVFKVWDGSSWVTITASASSGGVFAADSGDSAAAPGHTWVGDTDTGIFHASTNALGVSTNGVERARFGSSGEFGLGGSSSAAIGMYNTRNISGSSTAYGNYTLATILSDVTTTAHGYRATLHTDATSFTLSDLRIYSATQGTLGAGSTVTTQRGFYCGELTQAGTNYAFQGNTFKGTGRWNFYANGDAPNYFAGDVRTEDTFTKRYTITNSNTSATASAASLVAGIRTGTPTANITLTVPTGTNMDAEFQDLQTNHGFTWTCMNTAAATFTITVTANTGHTVVGNMVVQPNSSASFITRKTAANTFVTYRAS